MQATPGRVISGRALIIEQRSPVSPCAETDATPWQPNLTWITDHLAIGGAFPSVRAAELATTHRVRAVVDLRSENRDEDAVLREHGVAFLHLPTDDHHAVSPAMLEAGAAFAARHLARAERVLIHCEHGIGRSATLALCVLVDLGLEPLAALELAKSRRALVSPSPAQYECWVAWLKGKAAGRSHFAPPSFEAFAAIAYRHLADGR